MASAVGWYPDPTDPAVQRYWDGSRWSEAADAGVAAASDPPPVAPTVVTPPVAAPTVGFSIPTLSTTARLVFGGWGDPAIGPPVPWERDTTPFGGTVTQGPTDAGAGLVVLLALLAGVVWTAWPLREGSLSTRRLIGVTVLAAVLAMFVFGKLAALGNAQDKASSGADPFGNTVGMD